MFDIQRKGDGVPLSRLATSEVVEGNVVLKSTIVGSGQRHDCAIRIGKCDNAKKQNTSKETAIETAHVLWSTRSSD